MASSLGGVGLECVIDADPQLASTILPVWAASKLADEQGTDVMVELEPEDRPPFGIITTQSCDVDEGGSNKKPWIQVAPVYELADGDQRIEIIQQWQVHYLVPIPGLGGRWVGDLRIEMPIEKSWLVGRDHQQAYGNQHDFDKFGEHVATYRGRMAMATSVYDLVLTPLEGFLAALRNTRLDLYTSFHQRVTDAFRELAGDALEPTAVATIFISDTNWPGDLVEALDAWWEEQLADIAQPFVVTGNRYLLSKDVMLSDLRNWIPQDLARIAGS